MMAASRWPLSEPSARKQNSRNCVNATGKVANGPTRRPAMASAKTEISATIVAAPRGPKRKPAQPTIGKKMKAIGTSRSAKMPHSPNISWAPRNTITISADGLRQCAATSTVALRPFAQANTNDAITIVPSQSRSNHSHSP